ncbi:MFS transporter [Amycolatopsis sp. Poz14]|uniref:MFS transporter n=1 Tax=Amycolatopsis sp. Poz14 TaxID=1447705 RepID=UPI001EE97A64|nr:MFS transporter [Amycolatopsis sp. Poz14]MCG3753963.1 MFS transporter [Amycolatopsis sp. Poz14]
MSGISPDGKRAVRSAEVRQATRAAAVGSFVEWFDFALYGLLATNLSVVFFPSHDSTSSLLSLFAVFGAAFVVRPLGAFYFGSLGDRIGRKRILVIVITAMSLSTFLVGLLPMREAAGAWVTFALVALRLVQGFSAGGEIGGANTFVAEFAEPDRRGYRVSFTLASGLAAIACAALVTFFLQFSLSPAAMTAWGWRFPFLVAGPLGLVGLYIRMRLNDSPDFARLETADEVSDRPVREIVRKNYWVVLQTIGLVCMLFAAQYVVTAYLVTYQKQVLRLSGATATFSTVLTVFLAAVLTPVFGRLCDRWGRKPVLFAGCGGFAVMSYPMFALLSPGAVLPAVLVDVLMGCLLATLVGPVSVMMTELFPTRVRNSGASIGYNIGGALFGGPAPYLATALTASFGATAPAFILIGAAVVTIVACFFVPETAGSSIASDVTAPRSDSAATANPPN